MNKFSIYILLILIYLGISKSYIPGHSRVVTVNHKNALTSLFKGAPFTVILIESFQVGLLIKSYFQKYKIIYGFKRPEIITVKTTKNFWDENLINQGMSIYRRRDTKLMGDELTPSPPGMIFVGDPAFGRWVYKKSGEKYWLFHRAYRNFPNYLGWDDFGLTYSFYRKAKLLNQQNKVFYGENNEFGLNGEVTLKAYPKKEETNVTESFKVHIKKFLTFKLRKDKKSE